jgi:hypothetical protein
MIKNVYVKVDLNGMNNIMNVYVQNILKIIIMPVYVMTIILRIRKVNV